MSPISVFWFRRDLRLQDNAGLYHALQAGTPVLPVFLFDTDILSRLPSREDPRVSFLHQTVLALRRELEQLGSSLLVLHGTPLDMMRQLAARYPVREVFANHDYEPAARSRDQQVQEFLQGRGIAFHTYKDQVIFEKHEVVKDNGTPYQVFGAYKKKWLQKLNPFYLKPYPTPRYFQHFLPSPPLPVPSLQELGFVPNGIVFPAKGVPTQLIRTYDQTRDLPALAGTTRLGLHLRFGTVSIREVARQAHQLNAVWLSELIWRDFFMMILFHFPHVATRPFHLAYEHVPWQNQQEQFARWCAGTTGYPLVDAGMRELNATGFMHNRVRMVAASFLVKHLLIDYRWGEAYFAEKLLDFDLAANNGNWQWCAGTGCDAAPYFRVFNPAAQAVKFDKQQQYIKRWVPEVGTPAYPAPMVEHAFARDRALQAYKSALAAV
ncbi:cryptochrome/photolyase family protein [Rufibacter ruber]|uniref:cryptochrome/photolyase family protein n=1 Tax=Rufibacter ruber TaxID=1783499 RepID=UPI00082D8F21|nr:deoxyribodipyrimidine photo-lyase [Rufibacter ruber]